MSETPRTKHRTKLIMYSNNPSNNPTPKPQFPKITNKAYKKAFDKFYWELRTEGWSSPVAKEKAEEILRKRAIQEEKSKVSPKTRFARYSEEMDKRFSKTEKITLEERNHKLPKQAIFVKYKEKTYKIGKEFVVNSYCLYRKTKLGLLKKIALLCNCKITIT